MRCRWLGVLGLVGVMTNACVGDDVSSVSGVSSGGPSSSGSSDGGSSGVSCVTTTCEDDELVDCDGRRTTCALGCRTQDQDARCAVFEPEGPATAGDLLRVGLADLTLGDGHEIDVRNGAIRAGTNAALRQPNDDPSADQVKNDIVFRVQDGVAIFIANTISFTGNPNFVGTVGAEVSSSHARLPVVFVAKNEIRVNTLLDLPCGLLGGGAGGAPGVDDGRGGGAGGGNHGNESLTGGGGGHATTGGQGGHSHFIGSTPSIKEGGHAGSAHNATFHFLGGGGGGAGRMLGMRTSGGGGGAAFGLIAGQAIWLGNGTGAHGINAAGCGGIGEDQSAGGGGGAGGFVSVQAPAVHVAAGGGIAANGGGGAGHNSGGAVSGERGSFSSVRAQGGGADDQHSCHGHGGHGGAEGSAPTQGQSRSTCNPTNYGGGGGGAAGRIAIATLSGDFTDESDGTMVFSPATVGVQRTRLSAEAP